MPRQTHPSRAEQSSRNLIPNLLGICLKRDSCKLVVKMDPDETFLRVHARLCVMVARMLSPRSRASIERVCLLVALLLLGLLAVMHSSFVEQLGCANELSRSNITEAQLVKIKDGGCLWQLLDIYTYHLRRKFNSSFIGQWLEKRSKAFEPAYLFSIEKGYLMFPEDVKTRHAIQTTNFSISAQNICFGNRWQQFLISNFIGYDTILINSLLNAQGQGYLYNFQTKNMYDLSHPHQSTLRQAKLEDFIVSKLGVLMMSLFIFFTTAMSVSFTLRETQVRMLKFTVQLQHHARHHLPIFQLIFIHAMESLVFVPIIIGILFFLFEFYDDQLLAFLVLSLVWLCELFLMISVRTPLSMQYFSRFCLLYFVVFHVYLFSYPHGFTYLAFFTMAAFMQHLTLYFWNHFEVPVLERFMWQRSLLR